MARLISTVFYYWKLSNIKIKKDTFIKNNQRYTLKCNGYARF